MRISRAVQAVRWLPVVGWVGFYEVSDAGDVRSVDRRHPVINRFGNIENRLHRGKALKPGLLKNGYYMVNLTRPGGIRRYAYVHDLVTEAFIGPKPVGKEVCHGPGGKQNNSEPNLRYDTRSKNALDRYRDGTMNQARGEAHFFAKLTPADVRWIRAHAGAVTQRTMADVLGVHPSTVGMVATGKHWRHVT